MATSQPTHRPAGSIAPNCQFRWQHTSCWSREGGWRAPGPGANTGNTAAGERDSHWCQPCHLGSMPPTAPALSALSSFSQVVRAARDPSNLHGRHHGTDGTNEGKAGGRAQFAGVACRPLGKQRHPSITAGRNCVEKRPAAHATKVSPSRRCTSRGGSCRPRRRCTRASASANVRRRRCRAAGRRRTSNPA